ncbi:DUF1771-domain-containing protein [Daedalea quercina L-15889]|uniref:DUF1771-domain-containing protein n=1 Tax=Daedalea quercina L-15889 TaxID=1314783 RepID=A0A165SL91_9APHY|nr:DUF1771-domain-containing protein [Daedalea quercina L-15889]
MGIFTTLLQSLFNCLCCGCETEPQSPPQRHTQRYRYQQGHPVAPPLLRSPRPYAYGQGAPQLQRHQHPSQDDHPVAPPPTRSPRPYAYGPGASQLQRYQHLQEDYPVAPPLPRSPRPYAYGPGAPQLQHSSQQSHRVAPPLPRSPCKAPQSRHIHPAVHQNSGPKRKPGRRASFGQYKNLNHENQRDSHYQDLRARANEEGSKMRLCFDDSHAAYANGNRARAKEMSIEGKAHKKEMDRLNAQASEWIFAKNNEDSAPGEVDLHGLNVKDAITKSKRAINDARRRGDANVILIVGKGLHAPGGVAKLKPAIENFIRKQGLVAELHPNNDGRLIVNLDGQPIRTGRVLGVDDSNRRGERFIRPRL